MTTTANVAQYKLSIKKFTDMGENFYDVEFTEPHQFSPRTFTLNGLDYEQVESLAAALYALLDNA